MCELTTVADYFIESLETHVTYIFQHVRGAGYVVNHKSIITRNVNALYDVMS